MQAEKRVLLVLHANLCGGRSGYVRRAVARFALERAMFPFKQEPGSRFMIEAGFIEPHQSEAAPVMLHMASGTVLFAVRSMDFASMKPGVRIETAGDFGMTFEAPEALLT